ncbi:Gldg family protein [Enterocloster sp. OA13]|uniref:Gldg family protein n=1 Tax=Enterocloster sp. OA13 TaxID=2914161 RepID=UPI0004703C6D|nr:Gldg family protein [Enterocloster sp. OA13]
MIAIYKKEVLSFYRSMMGYLYTAFLLLIAGVFFTAFNLQGGVPEFGYVLGNTTVVLLIVIPVITMRALGEEQRQKTDQLLFTAPVKVGRIVLGKFLAILTVFAAPLIILAACPLVLSLYGAVPLKESYSCFLAFFFMGAACIAIGIFISSITESQIIAAVGTFAIMLCSYLINGMSGLIGIQALHSLAGFGAVIVLGGILLAVMTKSLSTGVLTASVCEVALGACYLVDSSMFEGAFPRFLGYFSLFRRYYDFVDGIFDVTHLVYYLGVVVLFLFFAVQSVEKRRWDSLKSRHFKIGLYAVAMCILMTVIVVLTNMISHKLPGRYTRYDTSASGLYSISPQTRELVESNTSPVSLYLIAPRGKEDQKLTQLLEKYRDLNGNITVEYVDPVLTPAFVSNYTSDKVSDNSIIVAGENRSRVLRNTDLYPVNYDYDTGRTSTDFDGEGQITSAIHYVTSDVLTKVYLMNGHGENELTESFAAAMEKEGVETGRLNLTAAGQVPEDAGCLFLNVPVSDLTDREREVLTSYLEQGGRMLLITGITAAKMPNLDQVLAGYGVSAVQGMIVEGDSNYSIPSYPNFLLPEIRSSQITEPFIAEGSLLLMPNSHGIVKTEDVRSTVEVKGILTTSPNSYIKTDSSSLGYKRGDPAGPFATGVTASEQTDGGVTRIVWFSSSSMLMEEMDEMVGGNNTNLVLNAIGWMTEQENSMTIRPKPTSSASLRLTSAQAMGWSVLFVLAIPAAVMAGGSILCIRRKRRQ